MGTAAMLIDTLVLGVDPSLTATGMAVIGFGGGYVRTHEGSCTIRPPDKGDLAERLQRLRDGVLTMLTHTLARAFVPLQVAVEDPSGFTAGPWNQRRSPKTIFSFGAGVGTVLLTLRDRAGVPISSYPLAWLPKVRGPRGGSHAVRHAQMVDTLRAKLRVLPPDCSEHVVMAAGLAVRHHLGPQRFLAWLVTRP